MRNPLSRDNSSVFMIFDLNDLNMFKIEIILPKFQKCEIGGTSFYVNFSKMYVKDLHIPARNSKVLVSKQ